jgi:MFS family permease
VRRLLLLVSAVVLVDTMLYAALTPLLPHYAEEFGLSKGGAGFIVATYAIGVLAGAFPAGLASARIGAKPTALLGLVIIACASVAFAFAESVWALGISRLGQGLGSAFSWSGGLAWLIAAAPRGRRGQLLGTALGAAIFGALLGPVLGAIASFAGTRATFTVVGLLALGVAAAGVRLDGVPRERPSLAAVGRAFRDPSFVGGLWLMVLAALLFGVLAVIASLDLDRLGWSAVAIGAVFFVSAGVETIVAPAVGREVDRRGALIPVRYALVAGIPIALGLAWAGQPWLIAVLALFAAVAWGALFTPGMALLSSGADDVGLPQGIAFAIMNAAWATGAVIGPGFGGALGERLGDPVAYGLGALACALTLLATLRVGTQAQRVPTEP